MIKTRNVLSLGLLAVLLFLIMGCTIEDSIVFTPTISIVKTTQPPVRHTPTSSPSPTRTITATPSPTIIPTIITPTSLPTISPVNIDQAIFNLVKTNGGCSLPCWWGITPGITSWPEAKQILEQYNAAIESYGPSEVKIENENHIVEYYKVSLVSADFPEGIYTSFNVLDKYELYTIHSLRTTTDPQYLLSLVLLNYGKPDSVYIKTYSSVPSLSYPFYIILYYPEQKFAAGYDLWATKQGNQIIWCPYSSPPGLWIWSDEVSIYVDPKDIQRKMLGDSRLNFTTVDKVTGYSLEEFFQIFRYPSRDRCLETNADNWDY